MPHTVPEVKSQGLAIAVGDRPGTFLNSSSASEKSPVAMPIS
jgi:hypothetical protein